MGGETMLSPPISSLHSITPLKGYGWPIILVAQEKAGYGVPWPDLSEQPATQGGSIPPWELMPNIEVMPIMI